MRWPFLFSGFFLSTVAVACSSCVCLGTGIAFLHPRSTYYYHSTLPLLLLLMYNHNPCHACQGNSSSGARISQLVFTLRDYGNFIVGLMEFFNTPELFVNYNWIISALFGEFRHSRPCQVGVGVGVSRWEMDVFPPEEGSFILSTWNYKSTHLWENYKV